MPKKPSLTSSELGSLWLTYQQKTMLSCMLDHFIEKADDQDARQIMTTLKADIHTYIEKIKAIFHDEGASVPIGFTSEDVHKGVPKLYDHCFDILFVRLMKQISMGMHTLHCAMAFREDLITLYIDLTAVVQKYYLECTTYLLDKGVLPRSPYVAMPKSVEFVQSQDYLKGYHLLKDTRTLNTVEIGHLYRGIESNILGMQMMFGFAQVAQTEEVKTYFIKGKDLAEKIVNEFSDILLQSDIQSPVTSAGVATRSTVAPFSDKLMMYCTSLLCSFALGSSSLGTAFSLRSDLPLKLINLSKDVFDYATEGARIMIDYGWLEQPPQMEDRTQLINQ